MMAAKSGSSGLPFPFGERDGEQDRRLFGEVVSAARPAFKFETMASEFETAEDWNDSGIGKLMFDRRVFSKSYLTENYYMIT
jgi:hypothetical protein